MPFVANCQELDGLAEFMEDFEENDNLEEVRRIRKISSLKRENRRLRNSVSFQIGLHLTNAVRKPWKIIVLPFWNASELLSIHWLQRDTVLSVEFESIMIRWYGPANCFDRLLNFFSIIKDSFQTGSKITHLSDSIFGFSGYWSSILSQFLIANQWRAKGIVAASHRLASINIGASTMLTLKCNCALSPCLKT